MRNKQHVPRCVRVNGARSVPTACAETGYPSPMDRVLAGGGGSSGNVRYKIFYSDDAPDTSRTVLFATVVCLLAVTVVVGSRRRIIPATFLPPCRSIVR